MEASVLKSVNLGKLALIRPSLVLGRLASCETVRSEHAAQVGKRRGCDTGKCKLVVFTGAPANWPNIVVDGTGW